MSEELKSVKCGCGGEAEIDIVPIDRRRVRCQKCGIRTLSFATEADAITAWNRAMGNQFREVTKKVENQYTVGDHGKVYEYGSCGACGAPVIKSDKYCSECGARLDWSE